jgi:lipopolysaccharide transport protein LptA
LQSDELTLLTNAGLEKQGNVFTGDKIVYLINQQRVKADSVQEDRVRMVIQPKTDKEP